MRENNKKYQYKVFAASSSRSIRDQLIRHKRVGNHLEIPQKDGYSCITTVSLARMARCITIGQPFSGVEPPANSWG